MIVWKDSCNVYTSNNLPLTFCRNEINYFNITSHVRPGQKRDFLRALNFLQYSISGKRDSLKNVKTITMPGPSIINWKWPEEICNVLSF